jgi:hypothetical protein
MSPSSFESQVSTCNVILPASFTAKFLLRMIQSTLDYPSWWFET